MFDFARLLIAYARPGSIVMVILMYSLGVGIADFLGLPIDALAYWLGLVLSILLVTSSHLLDAFFRAIEPGLSTPIQESIKEKKPEMSLAEFRRLILQAAVTTLSIGAVLTMLLIYQQKINSSTLIILGISFILCFFFAVPPITLSRKGLGEVIETIVIVNLISAFGFLLQAGEMHRLLIMLTVPLTALMLAMRLALSLPGYGGDVARDRMNMMTSMGWERGMLFHNYLIIMAYGLIILAFLFGLPWRLVWPGLLSIPIGMYQVLQIRQIANGIKPNWNILNLTSIASMGLTAYLITLSLWIG
jgi:1,4-dihydroxy-2-naphthoate octaprenyltransferase